MTRDILVDTTLPTVIWWHCRYLPPLRVSHFIWMAKAKWPKQFQKRPNGNSGQLAAINITEERRGRWEFWFPVFLVMVFEFKITIKIVLIQQITEPQSRKWFCLPKMLSSFRKTDLKLLKKNCKLKNFPKSDLKLKMSKKFFFS